VSALRVFLVFLRNKIVGEDVLRPYNLRLDTDELDGFRYRARDVLKAVGPGRVRAARLGEIRVELLRSKQLQVGVQRALRAHKERTLHSRAGTFRRSSERSGRTSPRQTHTRCDSQTATSTTRAAVSW
jgi:hypothetical protein